MLNTGTGQKRRKTPLRLLCCRFEVGIVVSCLRQPLRERTFSLGGKRRSRPLCRRFGRGLLFPVCDSRCVNGLFPLAENAAAGRCAAVLGRGFSFPVCDSRCVNGLFPAAVFTACLKGTVLLPGRQRLFLPASALFLR